MPFDMGPTRGFRQDFLEPSFLLLHVCGECFFACGGRFRSLLIWTLRLSREDVREECLAKFNGGYKIGYKIQVAQ